ncbi:hypothetical protein ES703_54789 [subsurface metagenome]
MRRLRQRTRQIAYDLNPAKPAPLFLRNEKCNILFGRAILLRHRIGKAPRRSLKKPWHRTWLILSLKTNNTKKEQPRDRTEYQCQHYQKHKKQIQKRHKKYREEHREQLRQYDREHGNKRDRTEYLRQYARQRYREHPEKIKEIDKRYQRKHLPELAERQRQLRKNHPEKVRARQMARRHIPLGSKCEKCGSTKNLMRHHHRGYENPLDVITLCKPCDRKEHRNTQN